MKLTIALFFSLISLVSHASVCDIVGRDFSYRVTLNDKDITITSDIGSELQNHIPHISEIHSLEEEFVNGFHTGPSTSEELAATFYFWKKQAASKAIKHLIRSGYCSFSEEKNSFLASLWIDRVELLCNSAYDKESCKFDKFDNLDEWNSFLKE